MRTWTQRQRDQFNASWRKWYRRNAKRKYGWYKRRRRQIRLWFEALKRTKKCERCGEDAPECLEFHHSDPSAKEIEVSIAVARAWSRQRILAEIVKCEVLCANCHLKHHWEERRLL